MSDIGTAYVKIEPTAKGISGKIEREMGDAGKSAGQSFGSGFGSVIGGAGKAAIGAVSAAAAAVGGIVASATKNFADYEQLVGGVETLFGDAASTVINNADIAFKTAGISANEYMESVTSFSASLLQSLGGDTAAAAQTADMALIDMADNANKMGSSMESIQNAYQGFAKQNYTMLDNLKLGYGGTKSEMERLLADAQKFSGVKYDINNLDDVYNAIHVIQGELHISGRTAEEAAEIIARTGRSADEVYEQLGTTAKEASTTIQGSLASMKAQWDNLLTAMSQGDSWDMGVYISNFLETVKTFASNVMPVVQSALVGVSELISGLAPEIASAIPEMISQVLPSLLESGVQIIEALGQGLLTAIPELMPSITQVVLQLADMLVSLLPQLIDVGMQVIVQLTLGIAQALPELIPTMVDVMLQIVDTLIDNIDILTEAAIALMTGLGEGMINAMPMLIERVPEIMGKLAEAIIANAPALFKAFVDVHVQLLNVVINYGAQIATQAGNAMSNMIANVEKFLSTLPSKMAYYAGRAIGDFIKACMQLPGKLQNLWNNILASLKQFGTRFITEAPKMAKEFAQKLIETLKALPGQMLEVGKQIVDGLWNGIKNGWGNLKDNFLKLIKDLLAGAKDSLKIKSPSKVFADEVGKWIPLGIEEGIDREAGSLNTRVVEMTAGLAQTGAPAYQPAGLAGSDLYALCAAYFPLFADKEVNIKLEGGMDRFFRAMQNEARKNYQLTGATI